MLVELIPGPVWGIIVGFLIIGLGILLVKAGL